MIHVDKNTRIPGVEETLNILRMHNQLMPQFVDFDKVMMYISYLQLKIKKVSGPLFEIIGKPAKVDAATNMKNWLLLHENVEGFRKTKEGISLDKDSIAAAIEYGGLSPYALDLLSQYSEYSSSCHMRSTLISLLQNPISDAPSCDGHRMIILNPKWRDQNTGRLAMVEPAIQNFDRMIQDIATVPRGYIYAHTDSGQIEPRETYSFFLVDKQIQKLIMLYNDAYFGILHYVTMPINLIQSGTLDLVKMEITDEMKSMRQLIKRYGNAVMYGSKSNASGDPIKAAMIKRIGEHPLRLQKVNELRAQIEKGVHIFKTAFGTPIDINKSPKLADGGNEYESEIDQKLKLAINNPIQGTAADLMRLSVSEANKIMLTEAKKSYIINYVHDAGTFAIHEDDFDRVKDKLGDIVSYHVDGWLPINAEPEFGRNNGTHGIFKDLY